MRPVSIAPLLAPATALPIAPGQVNVPPEFNSKIGSPSPVIDCVGIAVCNTITVDNGNQSPGSLSQPKQTPLQQQQQQQTGSGGVGGSLRRFSAPALLFQGCWIVSALRLVTRLL
ncbi:hypothetical protein CGRA01v4_12857 [Colletotrichum graminicola]|uniref:Uncharacterized protein n=1 Tax=Colletotrichum graminicola (strain M1.001 / M2 / FGSC 10212) TaxID=645133 RepID=E3QIW8_COLGM|nr:uncharacterized protein GLRG_05950 [Colletotrichum graminicola M1.001]EFQ30806.1 hypothetical protein GLRG_05950 [Colletotrichum graminicola M1.001]WDK21567.1 hypothetical protein CGRA01v4_12857 [Colletotrichum graminicola]